MSAAHPLELYAKRRADIDAAKIDGEERMRFQVGDHVTDGLVRGIVTQLDPGRGMVGVNVEIWPREFRWDWMAEERLRLDGVKPNSSGAVK